MIQLTYISTLIKFLRLYILVSYSVRRFNQITKSVSWSSFLTLNDEVCVEIELEYCKILHLNHNVTKYY